MLVGVVGFIGSGKGTIGEYLVNKHDFVTDSFAKSLKDAASAIFGWDREMLEGDTPGSRFKREQADRFWSEKLGIKNFSPRQGLQLLGTEAGRNIFGDDIWITGVEKRWIDAGTPRTVITDCRFPNEIDLIKRSGGYVIRVARGEEPHWYQQMLFFNKGMCDDEDLREINQMKSTGTIPHDSETAWIGCDFDELIENSGELEEFEMKIEQVAEHILGIQKSQLDFGI